MKRALLLITARWSLRLLTLIWVFVGVLLLLPGCGGSDSFDPLPDDAATPVHIPAQPCKTRPESCR